MKKNIMNLRNAVLGMLLLGSANFAFAQTNVAKTAKVEKTEVATQTNPAIENLKKQVEANPKDNNALVQLAAAYQDAKDWTNALTTWKKVETALPDWAPAYYSEGYVYQSMKDNANAKIAYEQYIAKVKPEELEKSKQNLAYAHFFVAYALFETNKEEAKQHIAKSLTYDPSNQDAQKLSEALNKAS